MRQSRYPLAASLCLLSLSLSAPARADDPTGAPPEAWPDSTQYCVDGKCRPIPDAKAAEQAFGQIKAQADSQGGADPKTGLSPKIYAGIAAAAVSTGGIVWGAGRYSAYRENLRKTAQLAKTLERETARVSSALDKAIRPELSRLSTEMMELNEKRAAQGLAKLTSEEAEQILLKGLSAPAVKERLIQALRGPLGSIAESAFEKITTERSIELIAEMLVKNGSKSATNLAIKMSSRLAESLAPVVARYTFKAMINIGTREAEPLIARCLGWVGGAAMVGPGAVALKFLIGPAAIAGSILLDPTKADAEGTRNAHLAAHPEDLLSMSEEEAKPWIERYPAIAASVLKVHEVLSINGDLNALASEAPLQPEEARDPASCILDSQGPQPNRDSTGSCPDEALPNS